MHELSLSGAIVNTVVKHAAGRELRLKADTLRHSVPRQRVYG